MPKGNNNVFFISMRPDLPSKKIRADQVAAALEVPSILSGSLDSGNESILIYVKHLEEPDVMAARKKNGIIQIYDPVDNYDYKYILKRKDFIDGLIAASVSHRIELSKYFDVPLEEIPHHHCNFNEKHIEIKKNGPLVIGYIGDKTHYKPARIVEKYFGNVYKDTKYDNLEKSYLSVDIGFAYRNDKTKALYNSGLKLLNYMSFGIPAVVNPEMGYLEIGCHGVHCLYADNKKTFLDYITYLVDNYELRNKISKYARIRAGDFHITKIAGRYRNYLRKYFNREV